MRKCNSIWTFILLTVIGLVLYLFFLNAATADREYFAVGGEIFFLGIPHFIRYIIVPMAKETYIEVMCLSRDTDLPSSDDEIIRFDD